jgi:hypothetical protein
MIIDCLYFRNKRAWPQFHLITVAENETAKMIHCFHFLLKKSIALCIPNVSHLQKGEITPSLENRNSVGCRNSLHPMDPLGTVGDPFPETVLTSSVLVFS